MSLQRWGIVSIRMGRRRAWRRPRGPSVIRVRTASLLTRFQGQTGQAIKRPAADRARATSLALNCVRELQPASWQAREILPFRGRELAGSLSRHARFGPPTLLLVTKRVKSRTRAVVRPSPTVKVTVL